MVNKTSRQYSVGAATFAERLNRLFAAVWPPGRGPYRSFEVTGALARRGYQLSAPYLSQLRSGTRKYPSPRTAEMLAEFFGVEVAYFDPDTSYARMIDAELAWLELAHDKTVRELTTALMTLTSDQREELLGPGPSPMLQQQDSSHGETQPSGRTGRVCSGLISSPSGDWYCNLGNGTPVRESTYDVRGSSPENALSTPHSRSATMR